MLREKPQARPNIYQVVREVCLMRGTDVPIKDVSWQSRRGTISLICADIHRSNCIDDPTQPAVTIATWQHSLAAISRSIQSSSGR